MIAKYSLGNPCLKLSSDLAGELPLYIYLSEDKKTLLYSNSVTELFDDVRVTKPLKVSDEGISFLLQSSVIPPPMTAYQGVFIVGIGDTAEVKTVDNEIVIDFSHEFPFMANKRADFDTYKKPNLDDIVKLLAEETVSKLNKNKKTFLFHSAGKDSNSIAIALAEAGLQDQVTLVTHCSKGNLDESQISKSIAKKLGFSHQVLNEVDELNNEHLKYIEEYFTKAPFPCVDNLCLAYPLYAKQLPELFNANIIFGDGNDSHMISPPSAKDNLKTKVSNYTSKLSFFRKFIDSENKYSSLLRTPAEWFGQSGFSLKDSRKVFPKTVSTYAYWRKESNVRKSWDLFYFKSDIYSTRVISEKMIRKLFNFTDYLGAQIVLPFATKRVAEYFAAMPEEYLFDRHTFKNKLILRDLLKEKINIDSDEIGKMGWSYDTKAIVNNNWDIITTEISKCSLWNHSEVDRIILRLKKSMDKNTKYSQLSCRLIYRLYLLSMWKNKCRYLNER
ncbi:MULTISPECIES: hypothetical protein [unclassified Pseudoalteromonas]|uniref:hypothetical protein n=1 Tax=unclassified Pseudoalteromonas TaxID=194690 RepID=UPI0006D6572D|nr:MULTISPECIES: hypothetical protein [unclassified Pseudoalteromonas]KPZ52475.1 Asparagine synthase [Pseudoalteromonas sp. P1-25]KPZ56125.1 Asparagine synthase [Pseudoalteromonas sp. P1-7a]BED87969.1 hypothetical protein PspMM1_04370 [Pseudoalteromonas sp. MM1]